MLLPSQSNSTLFSDDPRFADVIKAAKQGDIYGAYGFLKRLQQEPHADFFQRIRFKLKEAELFYASGRKTLAIGLLDEITDDLSQSKLAGGGNTTIRKFCAESLATTHMLRAAQVELPPLRFHGNPARLTPASLKNLMRVIEFKAGTLRKARHEAREAHTEGSMQLPDILISQANIFLLAAQSCGFSSTPLGRKLLFKTTCCLEATDKALGVSYPHGIHTASVARRVAEVFLARFKIEVSVGDPNRAFKLDDRLERLLNKFPNDLHDFKARALREQANTEMYSQHKNRLKAGQFFRSILHDLKCEPPNFVSVRQSLFDWVCAIGPKLNNQDLDLMLQILSKNCGNKELFFDLTEDVGHYLEGKHAYGNALHWYVEIAAKARLYAQDFPTKYCWIMLGRARVFAKLGSQEATLHALDIMPSLIGRQDEGFHEFSRQSLSLRAQMLLRGKDPLAAFKAIEKLIQQADITGSLGIIKKCTYWRKLIRQCLQPTIQDSYIAEQASIRLRDLDSCLVPKTLQARLSHIKNQQSIAIVQEVQGNVDQASSLMHSAGAAMQKIEFEDRHLSVYHTFAQFYVQDTLGRGNMASADTAVAYLLRAEECHDHRYTRPHKEQLRRLGQLVKILPLSTEMNKDLALRKARNKFIRVKYEYRWYGSPDEEAK